MAGYDHAPVCQPEAAIFVSWHAPSVCMEINLYMAI